MRQGSTSQCSFYQMSFQSNQMGFSHESQKRRGQSSFLFLSFFFCVWRANEEEEEAFFSFCQSPIIHPPTPLNSVKHFSFQNFQSFYSAQLLVDPIPRVEGGTPLWERKACRFELCKETTTKAGSPLLPFQRKSKDATLWTNKLCAQISLFPSKCNNDENNPNSKLLHLYKYIALGVHNTKESSPWIAAISWIGKGSFFFFF